MALAASGFKIELKEDFIQAWLRIIEPVGITLGEVSQASKTLRISYGVDHALLHKLAQTGFPPGEYLLAQGKYPENGEDGRVELLVELVPKPKRVEITDEDNRYYPVHINSVNKGQKILRYRPATLGVPGITVLGTERPAMPGRACLNPKGTNTDYLENDPTCLIATVGGNLLWDGQIARVDPQYTVGGDLSLLNGEEIIFAGDLRISGDVKVGMRLAVGGDLAILGTVEDAIIECEGDVVIKGGLFGSGRGRVTAGGSIEVNLAHDYTLHSEKDIIINREAINCEMRARNVLARRADVYGGAIFARRSVEVRNLGKREYAKTTVTVGDRPEILAAIRTVRNEVALLKSKMDECNDWIVKLARARASGTSRVRDLDERLQALRVEMDSLRQQTDALNRRESELQSDLARLAPRLVVLGTVRHNIHITVNEVSLLVDEPEVGVTFQEQDREIVRTGNVAR